MFSANVSVIFFLKIKLGSNNSKMHDSARNGKKIIWRHMAVFLPFLRSSLINIIKAIPKLTAVTHFFWLSSCVSFNGFKKRPIPPPPPFYQLCHERNTLKIIIPQMNKFLWIIVYLRLPHCTYLF